jgi:hypothetical protein
MPCPDFGQRVKSIGLDDEIALKAIGFYHRSHGKRGHGNAVSLPENNRLCRSDFNRRVTKEVT